MAEKISANISNVRSALPLLPLLTDVVVLLPWLGEVQNALVGRHEDVAGLELPLQKAAARLGQVHAT